MEMNDLKRDIELLRSDINKLTEDLKSGGNQGSADIRERFVNRAAELEQSARDTVSQTYDNVRGKSQELVDSGRRQVQTNPFTSLAWSFVAGILFSRLMDRK